MAGINEGWGDEEQGDEGYKDGEREREREVHWWGRGWRTHF